MKALKINAPVNLNTGAVLSSGSLVVISDFRSGRCGFTRREPSQ